MMTPETEGGGDHEEANQELEAPHAAPRQQRPVQEALKPAHDPFAAVGSLLEDWDEWGGPTVRDVVGVFGEIAWGAITGRWPRGSRARDGSCRAH